MGMYPKESTGGGLHLGNILPNFAMDSTKGKFGSFQNE
jgi:hypothetical protein